MARRSASLTIFSCGCATVFSQAQRRCQTGGGAFQSGAARGSEILDLGEAAGVEAGGSPAPASETDGRVDRAGAGANAGPCAGRGYAQGAEQVRTHREAIRKGKALKPTE